MPQNEQACISVPAAAYGFEPNGSAQPKFTGGPATVQRIRAKLGG
jgi:hypothetical protein